jgi:hypothetical protein
MSCIQQMDDNKDYWQVGDKSNWYQNCTSTCESEYECGRTACVNYCKPYFGLESVAEPTKDGENKKNISNKDVLVISLLILVAYLLTSSTLSYKITGYILPDYTQYIVHSVLFAGLVFLVLHFYKINTKDTKDNK